MVLKMQSMFAHHKTRQGRTRHLVAAVTLVTLLFMDKTISFCRKKTERSIDGTHSLEGGSLFPPPPPQYNVFFMLNEPYMVFGNILLASIIRNVQMDKLSTIFIADIGLSESTRSALESMHNSIRIIETGKNFSYTKLHSKEWLDSLTMKTRSVQKVLTLSSLPVVMVDSDSVVLHDFSHIIDPAFDIQICKREHSQYRQDLQLNMEYIASFLVVNNNARSADFLQDWIQEMDALYAQRALPAYETPALCRTVKKYEARLKFGHLREQAVSCVETIVPNDTLVVHFKSGASRETFDARLQRFVGGRTG